MDTKYLFPSCFRKAGWAVFLLALIAAIVLRAVSFDFSSRMTVTVFAVYDSGLFSDPQSFTFIKNPIADEILLVLLIAGGILAGFSRLKDEDEYTSKIRYESLVWGMYVNFGIMLFGTMFIYGSVYFELLIANVFTLLFFFLIRFELMLYRLKKSAVDEE